MQSLSGTVSEVLDDSSRKESLLSSEDPQDDSLSTGASAEDPISSTTRILASNNSSEPKHFTTSTLSSPTWYAGTGQEIATYLPMNEGSLELNIAETFNSLAQQIPSIWSFEYQMGSGPYGNALSRSADSSVILGRPLTESNSPFSDHIHVLQQLMKGKIEHIITFSGPAINLFYQEVLMVLALFNSMTRPDVMRWYAKTRFYYIVNLTAWQVYPTAQTFSSIHPQYKPTALQLQSQYPKVIDWIPFPSIRDRLIRFHAANSRIDQIFCDTVSSYAVETWMSDLIAGAPMIKAYIRVTDLVTNIDHPAAASGSNATFSACLPAPDVATLFSSPAYSQAVFNHLNMDRGLSNYKIDPAFFATDPELYDHGADISAEGVPLRPQIQAPLLTYPKSLDSQTFQTYRNFIEFSYGWPLCVPEVSG